MAEINSRSSMHQAPLNAVLDSILADLTAIRTTANAVRVDVSNVRVTANANTVDVSNVQAALNVAVSKLNADGGVSDTNYAEATTLTAAAATALTSSAATALTTTQD